MRENCKRKKWRENSKKNAGKCEGSEQRQIGQQVADCVVEVPVSVVRVHNLIIPVPPTDRTISGNLIFLMLREKWRENALEKKLRDTGHYLNKQT
jgi:hypothetical protein